MAVDCLVVLLTRALPQNGALDLYFCRPQLCLPGTSFEFISLLVEFKLLLRFFCVPACGASIGFSGASVPVLGPQN